MAEATTDTQADVPPEERETPSTDEGARTQGEEEEQKLETMWVESGLDTDQVALYEKHPEHPNGEAFVGPGPAVEVAKTPAVMAKLESGEIKESSEPPADEQAPESPGASTDPSASTNLPPPAMTNEPT